MNINDFVKATNGKIFAIKFIKRSDGAERKMICRTGVKKHLKGGELAYDPVSKGLITVFDMTVNGYRSIPIEGVFSILIDGEWKPVKDGEF